MSYDQRMTEREAGVWDIGRFIPASGFSVQGWDCPQPSMSFDPFFYSFPFRMERDAAFTQKKAERACLRVHLREKYRLPKVRRS